MTMVDRRKGWCPGALRPMLTGDGLLVRVRITGGILPPAMAQALAGAADRHGNGLLDLSSRANLQLRGVREEALAPLQEELAALGFLDADPAAEAVRNVVASPLAGHDPGLLIDVSAATHALETMLRETIALHDLPAKFGFLIDGGGALPLDGVEADIRFVACAGGLLRVELGGQPAFACSALELPGVARMLATQFLALRQPEERRMAVLVARLGVEPFRPTGALMTLDPAPPGLSRPAFAIAAAPFGRLTAAQLDGLARLAAHHGADLRLTPWRAVVLTAAIRPEAITSLGLLTDLAAPILRIAACPGHPACASGEAATQADAAAFAAMAGPLLANLGSVHFSGCPKGCARKMPASISLTAESGLYALAFEATAGDARQTPPLSLGAALDLVRERALSREPAHA